MSRSMSTPASIRPATACAFASWLLTGLPQGAAPVHTADFDDDVSFDGCHLCTGSAQGGVGPCAKQFVFSYTRNAFANLLALHAR